MCSHVTVFFVCVSQSLFMSHVPPPHTLSTNTPHQPTLLSTSREAGAENWGTEGCQTLASTAVHTKCLCSRISTYAVLAQQAKDPVSHQCKAWCTLWDFGVLTRQLLPGGEGAQVSELMIFCTPTPLSPSDISPRTTSLKSFIELTEGYGWVRLAWLAELYVRCLTL